MCQVQQLKHIQHAIYSLSCDIYIDSPASSSIALNLFGAAQIECLANGQWSNQGILGQCLALDTTACVSVHATSTSISSTETELTCPSSRHVSVTAGGLCDSSMSSTSARLLYDEPTSLSSWRTACYTANSTQQSAVFVTGVCCPTSLNSIFGHCRFISSNEHCGSEQDVLVSGINEGRLSSSICCLSSVSSRLMPIIHSHFHKSFYSCIGYSNCRHHRELQLQSDTANFSLYRWLSWNCNINAHVI